MADTNKGTPNAVLWQARRDTYLHVFSEAPGTVRMPNGAKRLMDDDDAFIAMDRCVTKSVTLWNGRNAHVID
jgi:hypothetical protein